ncbi:MAG: hypothetical protein ACO3GN_05840 [Bacteroidia bacterium]
MRERLLFILFGLEPSLWDAISDAERRWFHLLLFLFAIDSVLLLLGCITNMSLVSSGWAWALGGGLLLTYVFWSILRFSYLTIRLSPAEINQKLQQQAIASDSGTLNGSAHQSNQLPGIINKIRSQISKIQDYLGFGRWLLFLFVGLIVLTVSFPFSYYLVYDEANTLNKAWRQQHLSEWAKTEQAYITRSLKPEILLLQEFKTKLDSLQSAGFTPGDAYFQQIARQLAEQEARLRNKEKKYNDEFKQHKNMLTQRWEHRHFMLHLIEFVLQKPTSMFIILLFFVLFFFPLVLLMYLKTGASFRYFSDSATNFRMIIVAEHQSTIKEVKRIVGMRYGNTGADAAGSIWADEPFNTKYSVPYLKKTEVPITVLG